MFISINRRIESRLAAVALIGALSLVGAFASSALAAPAPGQPGPAGTAPGPAGAAPGPASAAPGPAGAAPGPASSAPGPAGAAPGPASSAPGPAGAAPSPAGKASPSAGATSVAGGTGVTSGSCAQGEVAQPFQQWGDSSDYELVPDGNLEEEAESWTLSGGAARTEGGPSFSTSGLSSGFSLELPAGSTGQTAPSCVDPTDPTFRFVARGAAGATLHVYVVYPYKGSEVAVPVQTLSLGEEWAPSPVELTGSQIASSLSGGTAMLSIRFQATGGSAQVDDVYIDPRMVR